MKKLFWQDAYMKECDATVTSLNERDVELDQTILFAFSGGQASDKGTINGINIAEARETEDTIIYTLEQDVNFSEGDTVKIVLDWENRYKLMRLHTAAHIVYYIFKEMTGQQKLVGSNITVEKSRIDYEMDTPISEYFEKIQAKLDEIIAQDSEVKVYDDPEKPGRRWWEVLEWKMPCGGTHVKRTSEIGKVRLKRKNTGAGKERIEIILDENNN